ncbi:hypothetical protein Shyhy01_30400 [Streptomyces hygroscopicus subsp. hygroscopicus]|nr:hypothetical protein Shyhy01_30400 [Streptomyces hygroscopicus subsp. hygroscopicus]
MWVPPQLPGAGWGSNGTRGQEVEPDTFAEVRRTFNRLREPAGWPSYPVTAGCTSDSPRPPAALAATARPAAG